MHNASKKSFHWAWVILAVCFVDLFVNYSIRLGYGVVLPEMIRALKMNRTQVGTIYNFYLAAYVCLTPFTGNLTDRFGARGVVTLFCILLGTGTLLMGTVGHFWAACIFFALVGAGASAMWTPVITIVQSWFSQRRRGMALGILSTGFGLGFATTGLLFPVFISAFSWRFCWYALGALALSMVLVNGFFLRSRPEDLQMSAWGEEGDDLPKNSNKEGRYREIFRSSRFWTIGASYFFISCALYPITTFMVDYANVELGLGLKRASSLATIHGLGQVVGVLTIPMLSDRIGRRLTLMSSNVVIALSILGVVTSATTSVRSGIPILFASIALLGIFYGITWPMYGACGGDYFRKEVMGTVIGAWTPFYGLGAILAQFISGRIRDITQSFHGAFYLGILFALAAAFLMQRVKAPRKALT